MNTVKPIQYAAKWAAVYAIYTVLLQVVFPFLGVHTDANVQISGAKQAMVYLLSYGPFLALIYIVQRKYSQLNAQFVFIQRFSAGFTAAGFAAIFSGVLLLLYYQYISHDLFQNMKSAALASAGDDVKRIANARKMMPYVPFLYLVGNMFYTILTGIFLSLIAAATIKNKS